MSKLMYLFAFLCIFSVKVFAVNTSVTTQMQWNSLGTVIPAGDTVFIEESAVIVNTTMPGISIQGVLIVYGSFTMDMSGAGIAAIGKVINYGTFVVNQGLAIIGTFVNAGMMDLMSAGIDIVTGGLLVNNGTIMHGPAIVNNGLFAGDCGTIIGPGVENREGDSTVTPLGSQCNDGDAGTENDVIVNNEPCLCQGSLIAPIPTMSQWALIILCITLATLGVITIRNKQKDWSAL